MEVLPFLGTGAGSGRGGRAARWTKSKKNNASSVADSMRLGIVQGSGQMPLEVSRGHQAE